MKKVFITQLLAFAAMNINAQLVVDSLGHVGIGIDSVKSDLAIGSAGDEYIAINCKVIDKEMGLDVVNVTNAECSIFGVQTNAKNTIGSCYGVFGSALGGRSTTPTQDAIALAGYASRSYTSIGIMGGRFFGSYIPTNFAGVYGSETGMFPYFYNSSGTYAGYFYGKVLVTNGIYATVLSPSASSSSSQNGTTTLLSDRGESVTNKLGKVQALQFLRYEPTEETKLTRGIPTDKEIDNMSPAELDSAVKAIGPIEPDRYLSPVQYGLNAEQLKAVYPELVYEDANGNVSINYVEMVPLLVQSINELSAKVAELEGKASKKAKAQTDATIIEDNVPDVDMVRMDQNKPNPFSESTVIALNIPTDAQTAGIFIYDMSGKQVKSIPVTERGETNITVYAADLTAGMYIYTLVVDGKVAVTRRMIVSEI